MNLTLSRDRYVICWDLVSLLLEKRIKCLCTKDWRHVSRSIKKLIFLLHVSSNMWCGLQVNAVQPKGWTVQLFIWHIPKQINPLVMSYMMLEKGLCKKNLPLPAKSEKVTRWEEEIRAILIVCLLFLSMSFQHNHFTMKDVVASKRHILSVFPEPMALYFTSGIQ